MPPLGGQTQRSCLKAGSVQRRPSLRHLKGCTQQQETQALPEPRERGRRLRRHSRQRECRLYPPRRHSRQRECRLPPKSLASPFPPEAGGANVHVSDFSRLRQPRVVTLSVLGNHKSRAVPGERRPKASVVCAKTLKTRYFAGPLPASLCRTLSQLCRSFVAVCRSFVALCDPAPAREERRDLGERLPRHGDTAFRKVEGFAGDGEVIRDALPGSRCQDRGRAMRDRIRDR